MNTLNAFQRLGRFVPVLLGAVSLSPLTSRAQTSGTNDSKVPTPQFRPAYHFTPLKTWTNDPNGLFYKDGIFHLYYQNNPFDNVWGHMSWGHATSKDLVHWQHLPVAIAEINKPDTTISIFSGSAVIDVQNTSNFGEKGKPPIVAIFTGDLPKQKKQAQYIAYSNDGGKTFTVYPGDPVIDINRPEFRDPNVFWYAPAQQWIMAVSLVHEHKIRFYGSKNLKNWDPLSDFGPAGYTGHDWECPALFPLAVNGNPADIRWVLLVSCWGTKGPYMQYFIGEFDGKTFHNDNPGGNALTLDEGDCFYAAIPWRLDQNQQLLIGWLVPGKINVSPWRGQMSIPRRLSLRRTADGIRLFQQPAPIIRQHLNRLSGGKQSSLENIMLNDSFIDPFKNKTHTGNALWAEATIDLQDAGKVGFNIAQDSLNGNKVVVGYDARKQMLFVDCSQAKLSYKSPATRVLSAPLKPSDGRIKIQVLFDNSSLEVFGNDGQKVITTMVYPGDKETGLSVFSEGKSMFRKLSVWDLKNSSR